MELKRNAFKHALATKQRQIGLWCSIPYPLVTEGVSHSGYDWLLLDTEHSPADLETVMGMLQAAQGGTASLLVRPPVNDKVVIKRFLDVGAQTLILPQVNTVEEARDAVAAMRYPPEGVRGVAGFNRAAGFGRIKDYQKKAASELCCIVQVETEEALGNIEGIAAVEGIDGIFIGPADLAASLGYPGEIMHPNVQAAIADAIGRINATGTPSGILATTDEFIETCYDLDCTFIALGLDLMILIKGADALAQKYKARG